MAECDAVGTGCYEASEDLILCYCSGDLRYLKGMSYICKRPVHVRHTGPRSEVIVIDNSFYSVHFIWVSNKMLSKSTHISCSNMPEEHADVNG